MTKKKIQKVLEALVAYDAATDKFLQKCADGRARSVVTKRELENARELSRQVAAME